MNLADLLLDILAWIGIAFVAVVIGAPLVVLGWATADWPLSQALGVILIVGVPASTLIMHAIEQVLLDGPGEGE